MMKLGGVKEEVRPRGEKTILGVLKSFRDMAERILRSFEEGIYLHKCKEMSRLKHLSC